MGTGRTAPGENVAFRTTRGPDLFAASRQFRAKGASLRRRRAPCNIFVPSLASGVFGAAAFFAAALDVDAASIWSISLPM